MVTVKNDLHNDQFFYYSLNSPGLSIVKAFKKRGTENFKPEGQAGFYIPIELRQNKSHDAEFRFTIKEGETSVIVLEIENPSAQDAFFLPSLSDAITFWNKQKNYNRVFGIIAGIMLTAFLLNIFYAISLS